MTSGSMAGHGDPALQGRGQGDLGRSTALAGAPSTPAILRGRQVSS